MGNRASRDAGNNVVYGEGVLEIGCRTRIEVEFLETMEEVLSGDRASSDALRRAFHFHDRIVGQSRIGEDLGVGGFGEHNPIKTDKRYPYFDRS